MGHILSLDQGTSSSRAMLFDVEGAIVASAHREFPQIYPQAGWVEHDPVTLAETQIAVAREVLNAAPGTVAGIGIANQRETTIVWDRKTGQPVYNAIVWQDSRTAGHCEQLRRDGVEDMVRARTGLLLAPYFSATKIAWILDNVEGCRSQAEAGKLAFGTVDSWLAWTLTRGAEHVTDMTNASRTLLFDIVRGEWDDDLLRLFGIPRSMMPDVVWSSGQVATTTIPELGGIAIAGIAGDQQAALFGQLCLEPGQAKTTYGTGCFLLRHIGEAFRLSDHRLITTLACSPGRKLEYALEGSVFVGGAVVQWLRDNLHFIDHSAEVRELAASVADNGGVVLVPAFTGLGAPHWDPSASGLLIGLRRETQRGHIARAAVESIAFQVADLAAAMVSDTGQPFAAMRVDGGGAVDDSMLQFQADLLGIPLERPAIVETTALGVAYLAGLAMGVWPDTASLSAHRRIAKRFEPQTDRTTSLAQWNRAVERAKHWTGDAA
jgi:glycerol kinase